MDHAIRASARRLGPVGRICVAVAAFALAAAACGGGTPAPGADRTRPPLDVLSILPPGAAGGPSQRTMYDALTTVEPSSLTDASLTRYYKPAPLDPAPADVVSRTNPRPGVTIVRDRFGVPYVYGRTDADTAYGAGYAGTQDRMFVMDALRYAGAGRRSELLGATPDNLKADADQLRQADYTPAEARAQIDSVARSGPAGAALLARVNAFVDGVNAARRALCPTTAAASCPAPYRLLHITPRPYTTADVVYAASLVGGIFGKGGGQESANAMFLRQVQDRFGAAAGRAVLNDLADPLDPEAVTTDPAPAPYGRPDHVDAAAVALPDRGGKVAAGTAGIPAGAATRGLSPAPVVAPASATTTNQDPVPATTAYASNALLVGGGHTTDGHPIAVFGPQTGYQSPNFLDEITLHGPHYDVRGVAFANLQFIVLIGHGRSYAWSATSASGDVVDTVLDRLCNTDGSPATVDSTGYRDGDRCVAMPKTEHVERDAGGIGKVIATLTGFRTRHGIVQYRTTAGGVPVAVVSQRSTYGSEPASVLGFAQMNDPSAIHGAGDFRSAFAHVDFTFNWFYADTRDIASFTSGKLPLRAPGTDPRLPRWGDARYDWRGFLPASRHPQAVNPPSGYLVNWNNKPSSGVYAADDQWGWGPVQRALALRDRITAAIAKGKVTRADVVAAMAGAATVDVRGAYLLDEILTVVGDDPSLRRYTDLLAAWQRAGAHRTDPHRTGHYTESAAIGLFDAWFPKVEQAVLAGRLGGLASAVPTNADDLPAAHNGSAYANVAAYGLIDKDLRTLLGRPVAGKLSGGYCGGGKVGACRDALRSTLAAAVNEVAAAQKTRDPSRWTVATSSDEIRFSYVGDTTPPITWQNRPTFQQVVGTAG